MGPLSRMAGLAILILSWLGCSRPPADIRIQRDSAGNVIQMTFVGRNVTDADLKQIAGYRLLTELRIQECPQVSDQGLSVISVVSDGLVKLALIRVPISDRGLACLESATSLKELTLANTNVTGTGFAKLSKVPIQSLVIHSRVVTSEGMASLAALESLEELDLNCQALTLSAIPALGKLTNLRTLTASRTPVGANGLEVLRGQTKLQKLILNSPDIDDRACDSLNTMTDLVEVELASATITDAGLSKLILPKLTKLSLDVCNTLTDSAFGNLQGMPALDTLSLVGSSVQGKDLSALALMSNLKAVRFSANLFKGTKKALDDLKKKLPACEIVILRG